MPAGQIAPAFQVRGRQQLDAVDVGQVRRLIPGASPYVVLTDQGGVVAPGWSHDLTEEYHMSDDSVITVAGAVASGR